MTASSDRPVRTFVAIHPCDAVRMELIRLQRQIARSLAGSSFEIKWVAPETMHLTLVFIGEQPPERIPQILQVICHAVRQIPGFRLTLSSVGTFGRPSAPRVVWAGLDASPELFTLQFGLVTQLAGIGVELARKPFSPHFTLGRVKAGRGMDLFQCLEATAVNAVPFEVRAVELQKSELTENGAYYTVLGRTSFQQI